LPATGKKTILLSSHLLSEIELVANRMAIINRGELAAQGEVEALLEHGEQYVNLKAGPAEKVRQILEEKGIRVRSFDEGTGEFSLDIRFEETADLTAALVRAEVEVHAVVSAKVAGGLFSFYHGKRSGIILCCALFGMKY